MPWSVTIKAGLKDVVLPDMLRYQGGDIVVLSDAQVAQLSKTSFAALFTAAPAAVSATWPAGGV
jgi:hypothetical protein